MGNPDSQETPFAGVVSVGGFSVLSTMADKNISFVFYKVGVCSIVKRSELFNVLIAHIDAFHQSMATNYSSI